MSRNMTCQVEKLGPWNGLFLETDTLRLILHAFAEAAGTSVLYEDDSPSYVEVHIAHARKMLEYLQRLDPKKGEAFDIALNLLGEGKRYDEGKSHDTVPALRDTLGNLRHSAHDWEVFLRALGEYGEHDPLTIVLGYN